MGVKRWRWLLVSEATVTEHATNVMHADHADRALCDRQMRLSTVRTRELLRHARRVDGLNSLPLCQTCLAEVRRLEAAS